MEIKIVQIMYKHCPQSVDKPGDNLPEIGEKHEGGIKRNRKTELS